MKNEDEKIENDVVVDATTEEAVDTAENPVYSDDLRFEDVEETENSAVAMKKLREKLKACEKEKKEYLDGWQRMRADFANIKKDEDVRRGETIKFASEGLVDDLLPVLDSFSMAFGNKEAWEKVDENWRKGVEYIYAQMYSVLESRGLTEIGKIGEQIDPRTHIAIEEVQTSNEKESNTVSEVIQKGYRLHNKVIRPAKVKAFIYTKE
jgi:molecular chaperone GrpE